ncbi:MAG: AAA family ATPase [Candidatus Bathyarchaeota archaeon]|nr:AAA family ATPase [Candidatus Bathyarchaeota archaeon]
MTSQKTSNIEWVDFGVAGLDDFIPGLPKGDAILVRGEPGTGKTIVCLQFLYKGAKNGEKCLYITTEETPESIMRTGGELWSDFPQLVKDGQIKLVNMSITAEYASEYGILEKAEAMNIAERGFATQPGATRVVIDSLSSLDKRLSNSDEFREVFMKLLLETKQQGATVVLTAEGIPLTPDITEYLVDHLIYLDYRKQDTLWTRVFILRKSRSVPLKPQILKLNIEPGGLSVEETPFALNPVWFQSKI